MDPQGNIILPSAVPASQPINEILTEGKAQDNDSIVEFDVDHPSQEIPSDDPWLGNAFVAIPSMQQTEVREQITSILTEKMTDLLQEGVRQYTSGLKDSLEVSRETAQVSHSMLRTLWRFLAQPVWIPGRNKKVKHYSRGTLFLLDTIRFGTTFAFLFLALFSLLNYQSFWAIAQSYVQPLSSIVASEDLSGDVYPQDVTEQLRKVPSLTIAGGGSGILDVLPPVGPPENRIIIPALDLNVPIVIPPKTALLAEDWKQLEEDIQYSLQDGVVHYPGTAVPGKPGNFFITGHSSYFPWAPGRYKSVFARLHDLNVGDEYWIFYGGDRFRYVIREKTEIRPNDVSVLDQPVDARIGTLMTCTPIGTTLRRLIIKAEEIDPVTGEVLDVGEHRQTETTPKFRMDVLPI